MTREVRMMRCPPLCGKSKKTRKILKRKKAVRRQETRKMEEEKAINWAANEKEDWGREEKIELNHRKIETMVPKRFHQ